MNLKTTLNYIFRPFCDFSGVYYTFLDWEKNIAKSRLRDYYVTDHFLDWSRF